MKKVFSFFFGTSFRKGASIISFLTLLSYLLGLLRDRLFAQTFGASRILDTYNASFIIPDLLLNIFVAAALTAAFIPVFTHLWSTGEHEKAEGLATTVLAGALILIFFVGAIALLAMPLLVNIVAPGFQAAEKETLISVSRLMLISPMIFAVSNTLGNMLVSYERFFGYSLSPILYNLGIISGIWFAPKFGIYGLVIGTLIGALLHLLTRIITLSKTHFKFKFPLDFSSSYFKKVIKLMIPKMLGQPIEQVIFLVFTNLASTLFVGSIAILSFARNFQSVPVSLFGIAFSTAVFSSLSQKVAQNEEQGFKHHFWETAKWLIIASVSSAVFFFFFGELVIKILLGGGKFDAQSIEQTGRLLAMFAFAIPAESMIHLLARGFYAFKDTLTVVLITVCGLGLNIILAKILISTFGLTGLPISYAIAMNANMAVMAVLLYRKYKANFQVQNPNDHPILNAKDMLKNKFS